MIENNIHQIWVGNKRIPAHIKEYMDEVKQHHTDFNYYFWNDDNLPELPENLKEIYDSYEHPAIKSDLLRMYIIHQFGGIYLDADFKTINGFYSEIVSHKDHDGFIMYDESYGISALSNGIFGFNKNNSLLGYMINNVIHKNQWIGPNWWSQVICKYLELDWLNSTFEQLVEKANSISLQVVYARDIGTNCFRHDALASWIDGSTWNEKLKTGDYD